MLAISIIGGRPNIIKAGPIHHGLVNAGIRHKIIDTGVILRAYGEKTYSELGLPKPSIVLKQSPYNDYLANIKFLSKQMNEALDVMKPTIILVYGDIDPGVAAAFSSANKKIPFVHVEAGLRNYEIDDTEEVNRLIIDKFSKFLFCTSSSARTNLIKEGYDKKNIYIVGNAIVAALRNHLNSANKNILQELGLINKKYALLTIHREENLTSPGRLDNIFLGIKTVQERTPLVFITYSSTNKALAQHGYNIFSTLENIKTINTLPYHDYLGILQGASFVITDSSGIQDETTFLGIPCITCRDTTHRSDTISFGNNHLVSDDPEKIISEAKKAPTIDKKAQSYPKEWDLDIGKLIASILLEHKEVFYDKHT